MDDAVQNQVQVIHRVVNVLTKAHIGVWLFGGWDLDARIEWITRSHGDIEFWVSRYDSASSKAALVIAGATELTKQPAEEAWEFVWEGVDFSTGYFDREEDGKFYQPLGCCADWLFPPDSFGEDPGVLHWLPRAMSVVGMLAVMEQFPAIRNGRP